MISSKERETSGNIIINNLYSHKNSLSSLKKSRVAQKHEEHEEKIKELLSKKRTLQAYQTPRVMQKNQ